MAVQDIVAQAEKIAGWMTRAELSWLVYAASTRKLIIEIGSWKGRSTKALAASTAGIVYAVDHWAYKKTYKEIQSRGPEAIYTDFVTNLKDELAAGRLVPVRGESLDSAKKMQKRLGGAGAEMIFIDADHGYESVRNDILVWQPLLAPGGLLCGHDYSKAWPGVMKAVDQFLPKRAIAPGTTIWWLKCNEQR